MVQNREKNTTISKITFPLCLWPWLMPNIDSFGLVVVSQGILMTIIFQSTELWEDITGEELIPSLGRNVHGVTVSPLVAGNSTFPFRTWLMEPFTNAIPTPKQRYFNYQLSRGRMVTEGAYGQLKSRWRVLLRTCESRQEEVKVASLASIVLHNRCIDRGDTIPQKLDLTRDPSTGELRDRETIRRLLQLRDCPKIRDTCPQATRIQYALVEKFWREREGRGVCKMFPLIIKWFSSIFLRIIIL